MVRWPRDLGARPQTQRIGHGHNGLAADNGIGHSQLQTDLAAVEDGLEHIQFYGEETIAHRHVVLHDRLVIDVSAGRVAVEAETAWLRVPFTGTPPSRSTPW